MATPVQSRHRKMRFLPALVACVFGVATSTANAQPSGGCDACFAALEAAPGACESLYCGNEPITFEEAAQQFLSEADRPSCLDPPCSVADHSSVCFNFVLSACPDGQSGNGDQDPTSSTPVPVGDGDGGPSTLIPAECANEQPRTPLECGLNATTPEFDQFRRQPLPTPACSCIGYDFPEEVRRRFISSGTIVVSPIYTEFASAAEFDGSQSIFEFAGFQNVLPQSCYSENENGDSVGVLTGLENVATLEDIDYEQVCPCLLYVGPQNRQGTIGMENKNCRENSTNSDLLTLSGARVQKPLATRSVRSPHAPSPFHAVTWCAATLL